MQTTLSPSIMTKLLRTRSLRKNHNVVMTVASFGRFLCGTHWACLADRYKVTDCFPDGYTNLPLHPQCCQCLSYPILMHLE